jgi:hypothetical protein
LGLALAVCALLLAACQFRATTRINPDGSGELRTEVGFTAEERANLESQSSGGSAQDFCNTQGQTRAAVAVTEEQRGDETWCVTTTQFDSLDELRELYEEQEGITINRLEVAEDRLHYDVEMDTSSQGSGFSAFNAITWTVTLPGAPTNHNADDAEGNALTWSVTPQSGVVNFRAESAAESPRSLLPLVIGGVIVGGVCGVVLLGGVGAMFLMRRSHRPPR